jgi:CSLREA domain-containing protein
LGKSTSFNHRKSRLTPETMRNFTRRSLLLLLTLLLAGSSAAFAQEEEGPLLFAPDATFVVNSTADLPDAVEDALCAAADGSCTLRAAISAANLLSGNDTITLPAGVYTLSLAGETEDLNASGDLDVNFFGNSGTLTIQGAGRDATIIEVAPALAGERIIQVHNALLTLNNATLRNGKANGKGGAILAENAAPQVSPALSLNTVAFLNNRATEGGAFRATMATATALLVQGNSATSSGGGGVSAALMTVTNSQFLSNTAQGASGFGGGLNVTNLTMADTTLRSNTAGNRGGGVECGTCNLQRVVVESNNATGNGGGISSSTLILEASQVRSNTSAQIGGGIHTVSLQAQNVVVQGNSAPVAGGILLSSISTIAASTIQDNRATTGDGGGIESSSGLLTLKDSVVTNNRASRDGGGIIGRQLALSATSVISNAAGVNGGGIFLTGPSSLPATTIAGSTLSLNRAATGGGIYVDGSTPLQMERVLITENVATTQGGGLYSEAATSVQITEATLRQNQAAEGGAMRTFGDTTLSLSTLHANSATTLGGAIANGGPLVVTNSTISGNSAPTGGGMHDSFAGAELVALRGVTLVKNQASSQAGGLFIVAAGAAPQVETSILADNQAGDPLAPSDCMGAFDVYANTLLKTTTGCIATTQPAVTLFSAQAPGLGALSNNGGFGLTHLPSAGAFVIDIGGACASRLPTDQRGVARPVGTECDLGAVEWTAAIVPTSTPVPTFTPTPVPTNTPTPTKTPIPTNTPVKTGTPIGTLTTPVASPSPQGTPKIYLPTVRN